MIPEPKPYFGHFNNHTFAYNEQNANNINNLNNDSEDDGLYIEFNFDKSEDDNIHIEFNAAHSDDDSKTISEPAAFVLKSSNDTICENEITKKFKTDEGAKPVVYSNTVRELEHNKTPRIKLVTHKKEKPTTIELQQLYDRLIDNNTNSTPSQRFKKLSNIFTLCPSENSNELPYLFLKIDMANSVNDKNVNMHFYIEELEHDTQCLDEADQYPGRTSDTKQLYHVISSCVENTLDNFYFQIRFDKQFSNAEIIHIGANQGISGTKVKEICMRILDFIKPEIAILLDDSKIPHKKPEQDKYLRMYMPIVNDNPKTWYSENNFQILEINQELKFEGQPVSLQSLEAYNNAVNVIRNTKVCNIPVYKGELIPAPYRVYLSQEQKENVQDLTVHELGKAIFLKAKEKNYKGKAGVDFTTFYNNFLKSRRIYNSPEDYNNALDVLYSNRLWIKKF